MRRTLLLAVFALALDFALAGKVSAFAPWLEMTTPCDDAPSAVAIGNGKIVVACSGESRLHFKDFP